jgi:hypothetical protein
MLLARMGSRLRPDFDAPAICEKSPTGDFYIAHIFPFLMILDGVVSRDLRRRIVPAANAMASVTRRTFTSEELSRSFDAQPLVNAFFLGNGKALAYRACRSCLAKGLLWGEKVPPRSVHSLEGLRRLRLPRANRRRA